MRSKVFQVLLSMFIFPIFVSAQPVINSVDSSKLSAGEITISGAGFGQGPTVILFDQFESDTALAGDEIPLASPAIGAWSTTHLVPPLYNDLSHSGKYSAQVFKREYPSGGTRNIYLHFGEGIQEIFLSYWVRLPDGAKFPSGNDIEPGVFPPDSSWKFAWLIDQDYAGESSDLCLPTQAGYGSFYLGGNDYNIGQISNEWWSWNSWMRIAVWLRADPNNPTENGDVIFQAISEDKGLYELSLNKPIFDADGPALKQYTNINIPGWLRQESDETATPLYDDIYIATGNNSVSRIEIADSASYEQARKVAVQIASSWSDSEITINLNLAGFNDIGNAYIFAWDKDGNRNSNGFPITITAVPLPPSDVN